MQEPEPETESWITADGAHKITVYIADSLRAQNGHKAISSSTVPDEQKPSMTGGMGGHQGGR